MELSLAPASEAEYAIVCNLARFYIYDMAEHTGRHFPDDGLFSAEDRSANYFGKAAGRAWPGGWRGFPYLIRVDGHPAGFALVKRLHESPAVYDMGEFFVGRQHRRHGVGWYSARILFDRFEGQWEVRQMLSNTPAQEFWRRVIDGYTGGEFAEAKEAFAAYDGKEFMVQRFKSPAIRSSEVDGGKNGF